MENIKKVEMNPYSSEFEKFIEEQKFKDINYMVRIMSVPVVEAEDIYQESCAIMFENMRNGKLNYTNALSTYLLKICKNNVGRYFRNLNIRHKNEQKEQNDEDVKSSFIENIAADEEGENWNYSDEKIKLVLSVLEEGEETHFISLLLDRVEGVVCNMPDPCDKLLWMRYWDKLSHKEVAGILQYKSADISKTYTSRCLGKFKKKVYELINL